MTTSPTLNSLQTSASPDVQLNGHLSNFLQHSNDSPTVAMSRISSLPQSYVGSSSFVSNASSQQTIQIDDAYESIDHNLSPDNGILTMRSGNTFDLPSAYGLRNMSNMNNKNKVRVLRTPRVRRRAKTSKAEKAAEIDLPAPLSKLTENLHHVPIKDMEAWVNRTADVRRQEARKKGKIARPMNSFMMYRSAYADRVKEWCAQNNHQFVSQISGLSWPLESNEIREKYEMLALVERDNHQKAHPEYKFAPNKSQTPPRKKRSNNDDSDVDSSGYRLGSTASPNPHKLMHVKNEFDSRESTPYEQDSSFPESYPGRWPMQIGRPVPSRLLAPPEQQHHGAFYMNTHGTFPNLIRPSDEANNAARPTGYVINNGYSASTSLASIPGSINQELLRPYNSSSSSANTNSTAHNGNNTAMNRMDDSQLDPQLLTSHQNGLDMRSFNNVNMTIMWPHQEQDLGNYLPMTTPMGNSGVSYDALNASYTMQSPQEGQQVWAPCGEDEGIGGSEVVGKDFDQWIHHQNHQPGYGGAQ